MKLSEEYPNYKEALFRVIGDKNPNKGSDGSKAISYFLGLRNFKKGFDYYELVKSNEGGAYFSLVTMLGFKTILITKTPNIYNDLEIKNWEKLILKISLVHFTKEEYRALKMGYTKKGSTSKDDSLYVDDEIETLIKYGKSEPKFVTPLNSDLEYLRNKPREEWTKVEKFMKSNDEFLKLSMELNNPYKNKSGCMVVFVFLFFSIMIIKTFII